MMIKWTTKGKRIAVLDNGEEIEIGEIFIIKKKKGEK